MGCVKHKALQVVLNLWIPAFSVIVTGQHHWNSGDPLWKERESPDWRGFQGCFTLSALRVAHREGLADSDFGSVFVEGVDKKGRNWGCSVS